MKQLVLGVGFCVVQAGGAVAQDVCTAPPPEQVDPCIVGFWVGENDAAEVINAQLQRLAPAGVSRNVLPAMPAALGLIVVEGGAYISMPFAESHVWMDEDEERTTLAMMELVGSAETGYLTASSGNMTFCATGDAVAWLDLEVTDTVGGSRQINIPINEGTGAGYRPVMSYSCSPFYLQIDIMLPPPINRVQYRLANVGGGAFSEYFNAAALGRLGSIAPLPEPDPLEIVPVTPEEVPIPDVGSD